ncbi:MAG: thiamine-phosphate kinase [Lysobacter sp.]|nr:thiamine-phosphate kinase [Lysobacter sp.]
MTDSPRGTAEFDLIARIRARAFTRDDVILGIGDDAALLKVPSGKLLVVATDTLNSGVHFPVDTAPADIGWKALAVNLSDLAAMGAEPAWCTLSLSLPGADASWLDGFLDGFLELANRYRIVLVGGDTTRGPLSVCVTVHGLVDADKALRRDAAKVGDDIWVTGTLGDAAAALVQWQSGQAIDPSLRQRLDRPTPRIEAGLAIAGLAHACIDISDGLLVDLGHVCVASGVGAEIEVDALPSSAALLLFDAGQRQHLQASGGDDYELCFTAPTAARAGIAGVAGKCGVAMTRIGRIVEGARVHAIPTDGSEWTQPKAGYVHFA